jgi:uncharacterized integral membrane protein
MDKLRLWGHMRSVKLFNPAHQALKIFIKIAYTFASNNWFVIMTIIIIVMLIIIIIIVDEANFQCVYFSWYSGTRLTGPRINGKLG